jgi:hypothetical protein
LAAAAAPGEHRAQPRPEPRPLVDTQAVEAVRGLATQVAARLVRHRELATRRAAERRRKRRSGFTILRVRKDHRVALRAGPGGRIVARVQSRTDFGSPQTLTVTQRRGRWLGVTSTERPNNRVGWVDGRTRALQRRRTKVSLRVDLSRRVIEFRDGRLRRSVRVVIGAAASPTPLGRFAVTDKMSGRPYGGVYGCCVLALSGHQTRPPRGWTGGDRLAIHGTRGAGRSLTGGSAGCMRAERRPLKMLMRNVPLGTPVFVQR